MHYVGIFYYRLYTKMGPWIVQTFLHISGKNPTALPSNSIGTFSIGLTRTDQLQVLSWFCLHNPNPAWDAHSLFVRVLRRWSWFSEWFSRDGLRWLVTKPIPEPILTKMTLDESASADWNIKDCIFELNQALLLYYQRKLLSKEYIKLYGPYTKLQFSSKTETIPQPWPTGWIYFSCGVFCTPVSPFY